MSKVVREAMIDRGLPIDAWVLRSRFPDREAGPDGVVTDAPGVVQNPAYDSKPTNEFFDGGYLAVEETDLSDVSRVS